MERPNDFIWDAYKAKINLQKHRVSFDEALVSFSDPHRQIEFDVLHSVVEDRWLLIGISNKLRLLSVVYTKEDEKIRIISARRANQAEAKRYADEA